MRSSGRQSEHGSISSSELLTHLGMEDGAQRSRDFLDWLVKDGGQRLKALDSNSSGTINLPKLVIAVAQFLDSVAKTTQSKGELCGRLSRVDASPRPCSHRPMYASVFAQICCTHAVTRSVCGPYRTSP